MHTCAGIGGVGRSPPEDPLKPPATALAGAANCTAFDSSGIVPNGNQNHHYGHIFSISALSERKYLKLNL